MQILSIDYVSMEELIRKLGRKTPLRLLPGWESVKDALQVGLKPYEVVELCLPPGMENSEVGALVRRIRRKIKKDQPLWKVSSHPGEDGCTIISVADSYAG